MIRNLPMSTDSLGGSNIMKLMLHSQCALFCVQLSTPSAHPFSSALPPSPDYFLPHPLLLRTRIPFDVCPWIFRWIFFVDFPALEYQNGNPVDF